MKGGFFGCNVYAWGGHVAPRIAALRPGAVLVGSDAWDDSVFIYRAAGTEPWLILRWMGLDLNWHTPEEAADFICAKAKALMALGIRCLAHGLNEQYTNRPKAKAWELKFIERCHWHGVETMCSNYPYQNFDDDEAQDFKEVWFESDYNGPHLYDHYYDGFWHPRIETSLRYRKWKEFPVERLLCTEFGIENGGWQKLDIPAEVMQERMLENVRLWKADGALAATFFCMNHIDGIKWGPYYGLDSMYTFWGKNSPPFEPEDASMPAFQLGFKELAEQLGAAVVGEPVEDEHYFDPDHVFQTTTKGVMWYAKGGQPLFLPGK